MLRWVADYWQRLCMAALSLITLLSLIPLPELPAAGGDKLHHYVAYFAVALPIGLRLPKHWWRAALYCVVWSGCIELIQPWVNRHGEWLDLLANSIGVLSGLLVGAALHHVFLSKR